MKLLIESLLRHELNYKLFEHNMSQIKSFPVNPSENIDRDKLYQQFELLYELEYKYNVVINSHLSIAKRYDNILVIIKNKLQELISNISDTLITVFREWLSNHNTSNPYEIAKGKLEGLGGGEEMLNSIMGEYAGFAYGNIRDWHKQKHKIFADFINQIDANPTEFPKTMYYLEDIADEDKNNMRYELESDGLEEFNGNYGHNFETEDEAEEFIDNYGVELSTFIDSPEDFVNFIGNDVDAYYELYVNIAYPLWHDNWASQGIETTIEDNREILSTLENITNENLSQQSATLNIALNAVHQTGDMIDHYENMFNIGKRDLDHFTNMDVSDWNQELRLLGFPIKQIPQIA